MICNRGYIQFFFFMIGLNLIFNSNLLSQQNLITANPANTRDAKSTFVNPAILPFQPSQFLVGMKIFHVGFLVDDKLAFKNNYFSFSSPSLLRENLVFGITGQYFGIPLYNQACFTFIVSHKLRRQLTIGIKYNIFSHVYDQSNFDLVNPNDPVFINNTRKISHSFGMGLLFFPISDLSVGFSLDHINRPDISLTHDGVRQPYWIDFGIKYSYRLFSTSIEMNVFDKLPTYAWMFESMFTDKSYLRLGYEMKMITLEGQLHLLKGFSLNYGYDYPLSDLNQISSGSHQISLIYDFNFEKREMINHNNFDFDENRNDKFLVSISTDQVEIIHKKLKRVIDDSVNQNTLDNLTALEIGLLDSSKSDDHFLDPNYINYLNDKESINPKLVDKYESYLKMLSDQLLKDQKKKVIIFCNEHQYDRALKVKKYFPATLSDQIVIKSMNSLSQLHSFLPIRSQEEELTLFFPQKVYFEIIGTREKYDRYWKLEITDYEGQMVQIFDGTGKIPSLIQWDWKDRYGNILSPDNYNYIFYWTDVKGTLIAGEKKSFKVKKIIRHLDVEVTTKPKENFDSASAIYRIKIHD